MRAQEADRLGRQIADLVRSGDPKQGLALLMPVLAERTPFPMLGRIGKAIGAGTLPSASAFLEHIAAQRTMGGWVVIASALGAQLERDLDGALSRCRSFVAQADVWYGADILGERVPGPALRLAFQPTLERLSPWREDDNRWVRRTVGVAVHFWAKRSRGAQELQPQAQALLAFLEPMFGEWEIEAVKGVGWGLKTLGRHFPDLAADWLAKQVVDQKRRHRALMLRKALKYLSPEHRARATGGGAR
ncbi:MAG: DNA alkylation repair protein [Anaerolineales bacterium]|jgi:3-methyladenine DNA glycosylase AlkD